MLNEPRDLVPEPVQSSPVPPAATLATYPAYDCQPNEPPDVGCNLSSVTNDRGSQRSSWSNNLLAKSLLAGFLGTVIYLGRFGGPTSANRETSHENWNRHAVELNQTYEQTGTSFIKHIAQSGAVSLGTNVLISAGDRDAPTTDAVRVALQAGDPLAADLAVERAQRISDPATKSSVQPILAKPKLTAAQRTAIQKGDTQFFKVFMFDYCAEDGDVVEILLNGDPFMTVPITNKGAYLSIPVSSAVPTTIAMRGLKDGEGGITVGCLTTQGTFLMRSLAEGEVQVLNVMN